MQRLGLGLVFSAAVFACTADNPLYNPDRLGGDLAGAADLAGSDLAGSPVDLAMPSMSCSGDQRACSGTSSERCQGGAFVADRTCPMGSSCQIGYCQPPSGGPGTIGKNCAPIGFPSEAQCAGGGNMTSTPSCEPFVGAMGVISWVCAPPIGSGLPGTACTSGAQCRTGFCGSNGICFRSCATALDCPAGGSWTCENTTIVVEGHSVQARSCIKH